jgi:molecular chaperone GrpE
MKEKKETKHKKAHGTEPMKEDAARSDAGAGDETIQAEEKDRTAAELETCRNQLYRLQADFDNFRKRMLKEQSGTYQRAVDSMAQPLLNVLDDLERAINAARDATADKGMLSGIEMIHRRLLNVLEKEGIMPMECIGEPFDPDCHEAVHRMCTPGQPENIVLAETQRGYRRDDRVIRPAKVVVSAREEE